MFGWIRAHALFLISSRIKRHWSVFFVTLRLISFQTCRIALRLWIIDFLPPSERLERKENSATSNPFATFPRFQPTHHWDLSPCSRVLVIERKQIEDFLKGSIAKRRPHMCVCMFHAILKIRSSSPLFAAMLLLYVRSFLVWIYEENPTRVFMYILIFFTLGLEKSSSTFFSSFPLDPRLTPLSPTVQTLDRNLNFRKFLPSHSGEFLEK